MDFIDFRSDTVSWPTSQMREAMATAHVGDDVYGDDPTVNELEALAAELSGKEAALFVSSGTQGNLVAMLSHANRGDQVIMGQDAHTFRSEAGGIATLGGAMPWPLPTNSRGCMHLDDIRDAVRDDDPHNPRSRLICVENSSGNNNGAAISTSYFANVREIANEFGLSLHLDGARLFNATAALEIEPQEILQHVDTASLCLSKGLCAPAGTVVVGPKSFIHEARRNRKVLGGGMRQAGILAAAGIIALRDMTQRLHIDNQHAKQLAHGLAEIPGIVIDPDVVETNLVFCRLADNVTISSDEVTAQLKRDYGILAGAKYSGRGFRFVTHYWITEASIHKLLNALREILSETL